MNILPSKKERMGDTAFMWDTVNDWMVPSKTIFNKKMRNWNHVTHVLFEIMSLTYPGIQSEHSI
jgi:hypothetical protein